MEVTERPPTVIASRKDEYLLIFSDFNSTPRSSEPLNAMIHPIPFAGPYPVLQHKIKNHRKEKNLERNGAPAQMLTDILCQSRVSSRTRRDPCQKENTRNEQTFDDNEDWIKR
jgi:hypothetical protein